jgi:hypothetical protein
MDMETMKVVGICELMDGDDIDMYVFYEHHGIGWSSLSAPLMTLDLMAKILDRDTVLHSSERRRLLISIRVAIATGATHVDLES